jgi:hypothetical protein
MRWKMNKERLKEFVGKMGKKFKDEEIEVVKKFHENMRKIEKIGTSKNKEVVR